MDYSRINKLQPEVMEADGGKDAYHSYHSPRLMNCKQNLKATKSSQVLTSG